MGTPDHPVYSTSVMDYVELAEAPVGSSLLCGDLDSGVVERVRVHHGLDAVVHNLRIEGVHNYFVGESGELAVLSHNQTCFLPPADWASDLANKWVKHFKEAGVGAGARLGQHGRPYFMAARELRKAAKNSNLLKEFRDALSKKADALDALGRQINHKASRPMGGRF